MKIYLSEIKDFYKSSLDVNESSLKKEYKSSIIDKFKKIEGNIDISKVSGIYICKLSFRADLDVVSSLSLKVFPKTICVNETLYFTENELDASEDVYLLDTDFIDVDNLVYSLSVTSLPIKLHADDEVLMSGEGYRVISEEDLENEKNSEVDEGSSPFDVLKDIDL